MTWGPEWDDMAAERDEELRREGERLAALHEQAEWERLAPGNDDDWQAGWYR